MPVLFISWRCWIYCANFRQSQVHCGLLQVDQIPGVPQNQHLEHVLCLVGEIWTAIELFFMRIAGIARTGRTDSEKGTGIVS